MARKELFTTFLASTVGSWSGRWSVIAAGDTRLGLTT